jgi:hypothetical protein
MKAKLIALLAVLFCNTAGLAEESEKDVGPRRLSYEEVLARWDRSRAYGDQRSLRQFSADLVTRFRAGDEKNDCSEGLKDGPWIRFYTRSHQIFGGMTEGVFVVACILLLGAGCLIVSFSRNVPARTAGNADVCGVPPLNADIGLHGVRGWLLVLCISLTIIGPLLSFAKLSATAATNFQWLWGIALILFSLTTGILLWTERPIGLHVAKAYFWSIAGLAWLLVSLGNNLEYVSQAIATSAVCGIWLAYLSASERVLNTYRRRADVTSILPQSLPTASVVSLDAELRALSKLREDGIISDDEFDRKKKAILNI